MLFKLFKKINSVLFGKNLGRIPGTRWLHGFLYNILKPKEEIVVVVNGLKMFLNPRDSGEVKDILLRGVYDKLETEIVCESIKTGDIVLDIGAHIGYFTLVLARTVGESGKVFAFEPEPKNFSLLKKNIEVNNFKNVVLENFALSSAFGKSKLFLDKRNFGNMSLSSYNIPQKDLVGHIDVDLMPLDSYANKIGDRVSFIKIDVQGTEGLVFEGSKRMLFKDKPTILMEFWPYGLKNSGTDPLELLSMFRNLGYKFFVLDVKNQLLKEKHPEDIMNVSANRESGKGWANVLCKI